MKKNCSVSYIGVGDVVTQIHRCRVEGLSDAQVQDGGMHGHTIHDGGTQKCIDAGWMGANCTDAQLQDIVIHRCTGSG